MFWEVMRDFNRLRPVSSDLSLDLDGILGILECLGLGGNMNIIMLILQFL